MSTPTKIYLPNRTHYAKTPSALYRRLCLNRKQIEILAKAIPASTYTTFQSAGPGGVYELRSAATLRFGDSRKDSSLEVLNMRPTTVTMGG